MSFRSRARIPLWLLALALLLAQALGQVHRTLHGPVLQARTVQALATGGTEPAALGRHADAFGHLGDADCRLYDQLLHADLLPDVASPRLPLAASMAVLHRLSVELLRCADAPYDARGPPPRR